MDHSRDPCPWVALSDFGGAFSMGVRPPPPPSPIPQPPQQPTNPPRPPLGHRRCPLARHKRLPQLPLRRAPHRRPHGHQGARPGAWRQLWRLGRSVFYLRLRRKGHPKEGGPVQCQYVLRHITPLSLSSTSCCAQLLTTSSAANSNSRFPDGRLAGRARWCARRAKQRHRLRSAACGYRGRRYWLPAHDG